MRLEIKEDYFGLGFRADGSGRSGYVYIPSGSPGRLTGARFIADQSPAVQKVKVLFDAAVFLTTNDADDEAPATVEDLDPGQVTHSTK